MPTKDRLTLWYCYFALGVMLSFALDRFTGVSWGYTIFATVPACFALGTSAMSRWENAVDDRLKRTLTPRGHLDLPGVGWLRRLDQGWTADLELLDERGGAVVAFVTVAAGAEGPSPRQTQILRDLPIRYAGLRPALLAHLTGAPGSAHSAEWFADTYDLTIHISQDAAPEDIEFAFGNLHGSDTQFVVAVKDWQVVDAYGAD